MSTLREAYEAGRKLAAEEMKQVLRQKLRARLGALGTSQRASVGWREQPAVRKPIA